MDWRGERPSATHSAGHRPGLRAHTLTLGRAVPLQMLCSGAVLAPHGSPAGGPPLPATPAPAHGGAAQSVRLPAQQLCDCPSMPGTTSGCLWPDWQRAKWPKTAGLRLGEGDRGWHTSPALPCGVQPGPCGKSCLMPTGPPFDPLIGVGRPLRIWGSPSTPHHPTACL